MSHGSGFWKKPLFWQNLLVGGRVSQTAGGERAGKCCFVRVLLKRADLAGCGAGWWLLQVSGGNFELFVARAEKAETAHGHANELKRCVSPFPET